MTKRLRIYAVCGLLACLVALAFGADTCQAQGWDHAGYHYWYSHYSGLYGPHSPNMQRGIPHFAAFPPVYYSHVVPRPYGYSPYAYVAGVVTPSFELCQPRHRCPAPAPVSIANPYVSPNTAKDSGSERVSRAPLRIQNPYFVQEATSVAGG